EAGVFISAGAASNIIGGASAGARNVISGNSVRDGVGNGVVIQGTGAADSLTTRNAVQGNFIGTDVNGTAALPNSNAGVFILGGAKSNTVGGSSGPNPGAGNVIAGNGGNGIGISDAGTDNNLVQGNFIGTNLAGTAALSNQANGVLVAGGAQNTVIGGASA